MVSILFKKSVEGIVFKSKIYTLFFPSIFRGAEREYFWRKP